MPVRLLAAALVVCFAPLAARAADEDFNPYKNTKVGDYATYKMSMKLPFGTISGTTTQKVTAKSDKEATTVATSSFDNNGTKMELPELKQTIDLTKPFDPTKIGGGLPADMKIEKEKEGKEKIKVGGKEYDCTWTTYKVKGNIGMQEIVGNVKSWVSKEVLLGMVKLEMTGDVAKMKMEVTMELTETGNKSK